MQFYDFIVQYEYNIGTEVFMKKLLNFIFIITLIYFVHLQNIRIATLEASLTQMEQVLDTVTSQQTSISLLEDKQNVANILPNVIKSVVGLRVEATIRQQTWFGERNTRVAGTGSGFFVTNDGYLITNAHVVENAFQNDMSTITAVLYDGTSLPATIVKFDRNLDLAVLKTNATVQGARFASSMRLGEPVFAIGFPLGFDLSLSITSGIISGLNRNLGNNVPHVQTDAAINPGNSGGPLFNMQGEIVGVNTSKIASAVIEGIGFAIMGETVLEFIADVIN